MAENEISWQIIVTDLHNKWQEFNVHGSVHPSNILVYKSQQDAQGDLCILLRFMY